MKTNSYLTDLKKQQGLLAEYLRSIGIEASDEDLLNAQILKLSLGGAIVNINKVWDDTSTEAVSNQAIDQHLRSTYSNKLLGEKSGEVLVITDASPVERILKIRLLSDTLTDFSDIIVSKFGKNLLDSRHRSAPKTVFGITIQYLPEEDCYLLNGRVEKTGGFYKINHPIAIGGGRAALSSKYVSGNLHIPTGKKAQFYVAYGPDPSTADTSSMLSLSNSDTQEITWSNGNFIVFTMFYFSEGVQFDNYKVKLQIEIGRQVTEYVPFVLPEYYYPTTEGIIEEIPSLYPVVTLTTNTSGVLINAKYAKDINKAFTELQHAIISLGGNV